jgi:hypothetical protein
MAFAPRCPALKENRAECVSIRSRTKLPGSLVRSNNLSIWRRIVLLLSTEFKALPLLRTYIVVVGSNYAGSGSYLMGLIARP